MPALPGGAGPKVGDVIDVYASVTNNSNANEWLGAMLTLPEGMTPLSTQGGIPSYIQGQQVIGDFRERRGPGDCEYIGAKVRVDQGAFPCQDNSLFSRP